MISGRLKGTAGQISKGLSKCTFSCQKSPLDSVCVWLDGKRYSDSPA